MSEEVEVDFSPNFYMVRDSGEEAPQGMDCIQLQLQPHQLRTQPFHYLINEQAKSLLALQELQNEVGLLLEFRDLVMETFPNLKQKLSMSHSQNYNSTIPVPLSGSLNSRQWEPGIKVKRKIVNKDGDGSFRPRSNSHGSKLSSQPKSSEAISGVQDSGFSTETNSSSKDQASSVPIEKKEEKSSVKEAEEELWNLLDVIHTKGTKLREEVETLQLRLVVDEIGNQLRVLEKTDKSRRHEKRSRSLDLSDSHQSLGAISRKKSVELEDILLERDALLIKLCEVEEENEQHKLKTSQLQNEISVLIKTKIELQEQLKHAMSQKSELNSRIHDLHLKFVSGDKKSKKYSLNHVTDRSSQRVGRSKSMDSAASPLKEQSARIFSKHKLGTLDGVLINPKSLNYVFKNIRPEKKKIQAILKEKNYLELQRHLLLSVIENQSLNKLLESSREDSVGISFELDKYKEENEELKFQLEEKSIELEGTKAQVRVLEKLQQQNKSEQFKFLENGHLKSKGFSDNEINRAKKIFMMDTDYKKFERNEQSVDMMSSNIIPVLALPMPVMPSHQSSGTESTQAIDISSELEREMSKKSDMSIKSHDKSPYKRRPSKIPLNIQRTNSPSLKKETPPKTTTVTMTFKKLSSNETLNSSMSSRTSLPRTNSQMSISSQKQVKKKPPKKEDVSLKSTKQRETVTRRNEEVKRQSRDQLRRSDSISVKKDTLNRNNEETTKILDERKSWLEQVGLF